MATCKRETPLQELELSCEFEDLTGLIQADLKAVVAALTQRAGERLLLTRRESQQLRRALWNNLAQAINKTMEPLAADRR